MTVYRDSKRIVGTNADKIGTPAVSGGWKELGRISGSRTVNNSLTVSSLADKRYYMILGESQGGATYTNDIRFNADSGSNYAIRQSVNGGTDGAYTGQAFMNFDGTGSDTDKFGVGYIANISTKEKLYQSHVVQRSTAGAGNDPKRGEFAGKWANTSNAINSISMLNRGSGTSSAGELVVLGYDPDDTHTTNFWEQLTDKSWTSGNAITTNTFATKKYLWIQGWYTQSGTSGHNRFRVGNGTIDTGSNYCQRYSVNGATDVATGGASLNLNNLWAVVGQGSDAGIDRCFFNMFIINDGSKEKLITGSNVWSQTDGAGTVPERTEYACKWVNTSDQINIAEININGSGSFSGGQIKVWGSN